MSSLIIIVSFIVVLMGYVFLVRNVTTIVHELGHAVPSLLFNKGLVEIYIGSLGNRDDSWSFTIGRLKIHLRNNFLYWNYGLCVNSSTNDNWLKNLIIVFSGPIVSFVIGVIVSILLVNSSNGWIVTGGIIIIVSILIDLYINLMPRKEPIVLSDGNITYNDGRLIQDILKYRRYYSDYKKANSLYIERKYSESAIIYENLLNLRNDEMTFLYGLSSLVMSKDYISALKLFKDFHLIKFESNGEILLLLGLTHSKNNNPEESLYFYTKGLSVEGDNANLLNNRGYQLILMEDYSSAIRDFDRALECNPTFAYALSNRGFCRLKLGELNRGLGDILRSLDIDDKNSYAFRNLGIYYQMVGSNDEALRYFTLARELDRSTLGIEDLIRSVVKR